MQLFTRSVLMTGAPAEIMTYAAGMCSYVSEKTGRQVGLWSGGFGGPLGAMVYAAHVEGLADLNSMGTALMEDPAYHAKLAAGAHLAAGPAMDDLARPIHGELGEPPPVGSIATVTRAVIANGKYMEAVGWGVEMAQLVEKLSGAPTSFLMSGYGTFGTVIWISVVADGAAADAAAAAVENDADYIGRLAAVGDLFIPGSGHRSMATRVA
jgi:hypothetical protein